MRLLLDRGAQADAPDEDGFTALMMAARNGHLDIVGALLDRGGT